MKDTHRRKLWATLQVLIDYQMCPLREENLKRWSTYDKEKGLKREYPIDDKDFDAWIKLDFNRDGVPDFSSPYQIRRLLMNMQLDFHNREDREILGRALYHIAQHRGFRSSKGETLSSQEDKDEVALQSPPGMETEKEAEDITALMQKSETKKSEGLTQYMEQHNLKTVGEAFAALEDEGVRIKNKDGYQAVRKQLKEEIANIFQFQLGLNDAQYEGFKRRILSEKKNEGTIFYKKPLRSQKGLVGKCTLEPNKTRCPISHPDYEEFCARQVINNIRYRTSEDGEWQYLSRDVQEVIFHDVFVSKVRNANVKFEEVRKKLETVLGVSLEYRGKNDGTVNYNDNQTFAGCNVIYRLEKLLGADWRNVQIRGTKQRGRGEKHTVVYDAIDIWNVCACCDGPDELETVAKDTFGFDDKQVKQFRLLYGSIKQGYASLSHKAIANINRMLRLGYVYSDAVMLAKIPNIIDVDEAKLNEIDQWYREQFRGDFALQKKVRGIANDLIASYKSLSYSNNERFAEHNYEYQLDESDREDVLNKVIDNIGKDSWGLMTMEEQDSILFEVERLYQDFFADKTRSYYKVPRLQDELINHLKSLFPQVDEQKWAKLYHPSQIDNYKFSNQEYTENNKKLLGIPMMGSIRNPTVMRTLNILRGKLNKMIEENMIDPEDTRVVVEMTRINNDTNLRWAIDRYNEERRKQNEAVVKLLREYVARFKDPAVDITEADINKARDFFEQIGCDYYSHVQAEPAEAQKSSSKKGKKGKGNDKDAFYEQLESSKAKGFEKDVKKYKAWLEQGGVCIYTGKVINFAELFDDSKFDIEHTIPRSISFDDSDINQTICDAKYNRTIKQNKLPCNLPNFNEDAVIEGVTYTAIKPRLAFWEKRVKDYSYWVDYYKKSARNAQEKDRKDYCIRFMHLWRMERDYWAAKVARFYMKDFKKGFRNSQLVDTGIITRYATLFLKSVFNNVDVQKGSATASYRKMLGVQASDEAKDRTNHFHHAVDATILTLIPVPAKRERMLQAFYEIQEKKRRGLDCTKERRQLADEINHCEFGNANGIYDYIRTHLLVNHISHDRTFSDTHRRLYRNGKPVVKDGKQLYAGGDGVRGRLSKDSFYAAIKYPLEVADHGKLKPAVKDGKYVYEDNPFRMVIRQSIKDFKTFKDLDAIVDVTLRSSIKTSVQKLMEKSGFSFVKAIAEPIYMLDSQGREIRFDKNGKPLAPIRHVRCRAKAGRGFLNYDTAIKIKTINQKSDKALVQVEDRSYKNYVYAQNDTIYLYLLYEGIKKGKLERKAKIMSLFEAAKIMKTKGVKDVASWLQAEPQYSLCTEKNVDYKLTAVIKVGDRLIRWNDSPDEVSGLSEQELSERLFVVKKFNGLDYAFLFVKQHCDASDEEPQKISVSRMNYLIEHRDFEIDALGRIHFKD